MLLQESNMSDHQQHRNVERSAHDQTAPRASSSVSEVISTNHASNTAATAHNWSSNSNVATVANVGRDSARDNPNQQSQLNKNMYGRIDPLAPSASASVFLIDDGGGGGSRAGGKHRYRASS